MKYNMLTFIALVAAFFASKSLLAAHHVVGHQVLICGPILNKKHNHQCLHAIGGAKAGNLVVYHKGIKDNLKNPASIWTITRPHANSKVFQVCLSDKKNGKLCLGEGTKGHDEFSAFRLREAKYGIETFKIEKVHGKHGGNYYTFCSATGPLCMGGKDAYKKWKPMRLIGNKAHNEQRLNGFFGFKVVAKPKSHHKHKTAPVKRKTPEHGAPSHHHHKVQKKSHHGNVPHGQVNHGQVNHGQVNHGQSQHEQVNHGKSQHGQVNHGKSQHGQVDHGQSHQGHGNTRHHNSHYQGQSYQEFMKEEKKKVMQDYKEWKKEHNNQHGSTSGSHQEENHHQDSSTHHDTSQHKGFSSQHHDATMHPSPHHDTEQHHDGGH